jgi:hypothetical protein
MKIKLLLYLFIFKTITYGQVDTDNISFDKTSDLTNLFTNYSSTGLTTNSVNGISSSGSLTTPNSMNINAIYCSKYKNTTNAVTKTSICFQYNGELVNPNSYNNAAGIYLHPSKDWNHYIMNYIRQNKSLEIYCYSWASANDKSVILDLLDNHWYKLQLTTTIIGGQFGDQIEILSEVFDLGIEGNQTPVLINSILKSNYFDITFAQDLSVEVSFSGSKWGGTSYLDNFKFEGVKALNSCNLSSSCSKDLVITPQNKTLQTGQSVTFTANTSASNPSYIWQSDFGQGFQNLNNIGNYSGSNTNTLKINNLQLSNHLQQIRAISTSGICSDTSDIAQITLTNTCVKYITITDTLIINTTLSSEILPPNNINTIKVYPNPANSQIIFDFGNFNIMNNYTLKIVNSVGQTVFSTPINQKISHLDLTSWKGVYFIQLIDPEDKIIENRKILIQ